MLMAVTQEDADGYPMVDYAAAARTGGGLKLNAWKLFRSIQRMFGQGACCKIRRLTQRLSLARLGGSTCGKA